MWLIAFRFWTEFSISEKCVDAQSSHRAIRPSTVSFFLFDMYPNNSRFSLSEWTCNEQVERGHLSGDSKNGFILARNLDRSAEGRSRSPRFLDRVDTGRGGRNVEGDRKVINCLPEVLQFRQRRNCFS